MSVPPCSKCKHQIRDGFYWLTLLLGEPDGLCGKTATVLSRPRYHLGHATKKRLGLVGDRCSDQRGWETDPNRWCGPGAAWFEPKE